jgi:hypothetical protein
LTYSLIKSDGPVANQRELKYYEKDVQQIHRLGVFEDSVESSVTRESDRLASQQQR